MWKIQIWIIQLLLLFFKISQELPIKSNGLSLEVPPAEVLNFMRRFGYLDRNPDNSEALYHESAIVEALKNIQKYGALEQTGKLDENTLELFTKPRCGVPDIEGKPYYLQQQDMITTANSIKHRSKRFIFGAKTWTKRHIKYLIGNRSLKIPAQQVERDIARAFEVWSQYSNLKFERVNDTSADIIIGFGSKYHGDNFPFDGVGNILAHAFYPYEMGSWGGDVHFDEDENWKENSPELSKGVDFYTVALHELGHSLGLAHSPTYSSIMFPYYKGPDYNVLNYDDTLAMYEAYLNKKLDDDVEVVNDEEQKEEEEEQETDEEEYEENTTISYETTEYSTRNRDYMTTTPSEPSYEEENNTNWVTTFAETKNPYSPNYDSTTSNPITDTIAKDRSFYTSTIPPICDGKFNAVCHFNGHVHIFKGQYVWKLSAQYRVLDGYPKRLQEVIVGLPEQVERIDACYERFDKTVLFFSGTQIWYYKNNQILDTSPVSLSSLLGYSVNVNHVDAVLLWPKNNRTYIFSGSIFWRYDDNLQQLDEGYPKSMQRWPGIPENIDAAATIPNDRIIDVINCTMC
ncbi:neutrophil collagenase-like [Musca autumnalis]|uniref:neutrophil collagenase-like n=1 Tax=Musca autumnalis TaxID=221902 RepID=UPI003CF65455